MSKKWGFQQTGHAVSEKPGFESQNGHFSVFWAKKFFFPAKQCFGHPKCAFLGQNLRLAVKTSCFEQKKILSKFQFSQQKTAFLTKKHLYSAKTEFFFAKTSCFYLKRYYHEQKVGVSANRSRRKRKTWF